MTEPSAVALVTGANKGLGKETARQLAARGVRVVLGSRDLSRGRTAARQLAAEGADVGLVQLDVTDEASIATATATIDERYSRLDILVNNAGAFVGAPALQVTGEQLRSVFETNVYGVISMIQAAVPLLQRSLAPRIVNVSSTTGSIALTGAGADLPGDASRRLAYTASKAALNMLTVQYARAFAQDPRLRHVLINSATPGYTATDINNHQGDRTVAEGARAIVELALLPGDGPTGGFFSDEGRIPW